MQRPAVVYAIAATLLAPPQLFASDDDTDPDRSGFLTRTLRHYFTDDETSGTGPKWGPIRPRIDVLSSGGGVGPVVHFWVPDIGGSRFDVHASAGYSIYRYQYYDLQLGLVPHEGDHMPRVQRSTNSIYPMGDLEKTAGIPGFNLYVDRGTATIPGRTASESGPPLSSLAARTIV